MGYYKQQLIDQEADLNEELLDVQSSIDDSADRGDSHEERTNLLAREDHLETLIGWIGDQDHIEGLQGLLSVLGEAGDPQRFALKGNPGGLVTTNLKLSPVFVDGVRVDDDGVKWPGDPHGEIF